jgi:hypothetical protein
MILILFIPHLNLLIQISLNLLLFLRLLPILFLALFLILLMFNLFTSLHWSNTNLVTYINFIVKWILLLTLLQFLPLFQVFLILFLTPFLMINCPHLINILFFPFLLQLSHNIITKLFNTFAGVRLCKLR